MRIHEQECAFGQGNGEQSHDGELPKCQSETGGQQGILPTGIFKQIFISHAGSYAIINPIQSGNVPREVAAVAPLLQ